MKPKITIDSKSGYCFGVLKAIETAESLLDEYGQLFCLGDIVHNDEEVNRLRNRGLIVINHDDLKNLYNTRVLIRAHGEHPSTYDIARKNHIELIDATCPVVIRLQQRVGKSQQEMDHSNGQVVIFGKAGHAEVVGLVGQTREKAIVIGNNMSDLDQIDFSKPIHLYSQTTQDKDTYVKLIDAINRRINPDYCKSDDKLGFQSFNTICGQVSNRGPHMAAFARQHEVIVFVGGRKSSNGKFLFSICHEHNSKSYFVPNEQEVNPDWFENAATIGICGATSTPMWLMQRVAQHIENIL
ncbi:MAG: 4-hydroxy-3-methylbut-2-enyl diphosphate reductase [Bacteroidota bacterium]